MIPASATALAGNRVICTQTFFFTNPTTGNKITIVRDEEFTILAIWCTDTLFESNGDPSPALVTFEELPEVVLTIHMLQYFKDKYKINIKKHFDESTNRN